ncbi:30S ribosomal protein S1 [Egibacter rhizosphaerae]|uniref:Small ribosomal subunit protein bS1 n=1 Tax=Egibacter rhizosphaerae TaxID=1670831 RepID=A0A411YKR9_9ACTN|nr:30S ribosomal protein S1 [Egibacter rhizosphaerae]QBI21787.1 30S ribosomal protein S1 [Egibacter rhizosphaerae]
MDQTADDTTRDAAEDAQRTATATLETAPREERDRGAQIALEEFGSAEAFERALEETIKEFDDGDIVEGVVVKVDPEEVLLDIGYKSEGVIPSRELSIKHDVDPNEVVQLGDVIEALVLQKEDQDGRLILSKKRAQYERAWGKIEEIYHADSTVTGTVIEVVKGGLILDIGLRGFLPASLVEMRRVRDLHPYVGRELECKVIELDKNRNNVVLSRRKFLEETQSEFRREFLETLEKGEIRKGTVSSIVNFGSFVDLGGVDGLVHVSELSWKHIDHPGEVVEVGQEVEVEVLDVDLDRERVSLSLKATQEDPWRQFARQHYVGEFIEGNVTKIVPFGAFVKVEDGIEGLVHISELAEAHVEVPEQVVKVGDPITVKIIDIDDVRRRISLSLKQAVKAGYGEEPAIAVAEEPEAEAAEPEAEPGEEPAAPASSVGAALEAALQQRGEASGEVSLGDVLADLRGQAGESTAEEEVEQQPEPAEVEPAEVEPAEVEPAEVESAAEESATVESANVESAAEESVAEEPAEVESMAEESVAEPAEEPTEEADESASLEAPGAASSGEAETSGAEDDDDAGDDDAGDDDDAGEGTER